VGAQASLGAIALSLLFLPAAAALGAEPGVVQTPSILDPAAHTAQAILDYGMLVVGICTGIFVVVGLLIVVTVVRFRARPDDDEREPAQVYGSTQIELAWTVIPVLIVVVLGMVTTREILALQREEAPEDWLEVTVVGHQWWWEYEYPQYGFTTANELHIPVSPPEDPRPTFLNLQSQDVIHSFWVPQLSWKTDLIPNRTNHLWIDPQETGLFVGACAEFCGTQHAWMLLRVVVESREDFERWVAEQQRPAREDPSVREGREIFERTSCINCHRVQGTAANGRFGPDLTHMMSRDTIGAGVAANNRENLIEWIETPDHLKVGVLMPAMQLERSQIERMVDYLMTLE
jgi:cytochrome c oxidase subunit 2